MRLERDNFRNKKEMNAALYQARLILVRKRVTLEEMREAGKTLNKAVRTLQSWLGSANDRARGRAEDIVERETWKRLNSVNREGPLIPLNFK